MLQVIRLVFIITAVVGAYQLGKVAKLPPPFSKYKVLALIIYMIIGTGFGYVLGGVVGRRLIKSYQWLEGKVQKIPGTDLLLGVFGLIVGLLLAWLISIPFGYLKIPFLQFSVALFAFVALGYLGVSVAIRKRDDWRVFTKFFATGRVNSEVPFLPASKILDTSVIIDGRIADVVKTGFIEGRLTVPSFVLRELQTIADSEDPLKRNRGRRGLDILKSLQHEPRIELEILEREYPEITGVDEKLTKLARDINAVILTNDYNLNKIADIQGVKVLNLNELANALKPVVLPGEEMVVNLIKEGKEAGQGVGYLDDGTMVVVDGGKYHLGEEVEVLVTSVLQTPAGRMIFSKLKEEQEAKA
jgi:uncharacterized protein YacL